MHFSFERHWPLVAGFTVAGALLGVILGLYEAIVLYTTPFPAALLEPDVQYVIWFLAPLVGAVAWGILGLALGFLAAGLRNRNWKWVAFCAAGGLGVMGPHLLLIECIHRTADPEFVQSATLLIPFSWFVVVCCGLLACNIWKDRVRPILEGGSEPRLRPLTLTLFASLGVLVVGLAFFILEPMRSARTDATGSQQHGSRPNIVLISLDTVRADHLSLYGYHRKTTPHLEEWARRGVVFDQAIAPSSWTLAAHASILTGLLPHQHGADWVVPLGAQPKTLAEILKSEGYETAGFTANLRYGQKGWGYAQGFDTYEDSSNSFRHNLAATMIGRWMIQPLYEETIRYELFERHNAKQLNQDILRWHRNRSARPYFLFVNYFDAHERYLAPAPFDVKFGKTNSGLLERADRALAVGQVSLLTDEEKTHLVMAYDNCLAYLDEELNELLRFLASSPEWSDTFVIITADHGEAFGEHGVLGHSWDLHREILRVPLVILGPDVPAGLRTGQFVGTRHLFSTVLDVASGEIGPFHRKSLRRFWTLTEDPQLEDDLVISELVGRPWDAPMPECISAVTAHWHLLHHADGKVQLYDLTRDPKERVNLADSPDYQEALQRLGAKLRMSVGSSLRPWRGLPYLFALDRPGYSFLREIAFGPALDASSIDPKQRIGAAQAYFAPDPARPSTRPLIPDEELLRSLPYH